MTHDMSAFWLYPDWTGPLKEPFWMRPLKVPDERAESAVCDYMPPEQAEPLGLKEARKLLHAKAVRLGFNCANWSPRLPCAFLGRHTNVSMSEPDRENWGWEATAHVRCCGSLVGSVFIYD